MILFQMFSLFHSHESTNLVSLDLNKAADIARKAQSAGALFLSSPILSGCTTSATGRSGQLWPIGKEMIAFELMGV